MNHALKFEYQPQQVKG